MAAKQKADWKFLVCVAAGWAIFIFLGRVLLQGTVFTDKGLLSIAAVLAEGVVGGLAGSYIYTAFFRPKNSG